MSVDTATPAAAGQVAATDAAAITKDVPEPASVSTESAVTATEPATESTPAEPTSTEEKVNDKEIKVTATPVTSGVLGYKAPGLINQIRFKKHFFWLGEEAAVPVTELESYRRGEKADVANPTVAWSSQTGKGLLYFTKNSEAKEKPTGIINLAEVSDIAKEGDKDFSLQLNKHKHHFQAANADERNGWLVALDKESTAAKEAKESLTGSEGYKTTLASLDKPTASAAPAAAATAAAGAATAGAAAVAAKDDKAEKTEKEDKPEERHVSDDEDKLGAKEKKAKSKSRSVSRSKRQSIFGGLLGKKEEAKKEEAKKEETKKEEAKKDDAFANDPVKAEGDAGVVEPVAPAEPVAAFADDPVKAETPEAAAAAALATAKPTPSPKGSTKKDNSAKRQSIFGGLFQKSDKKETETTPEAAKDEPVVEDKTDAEAETAAPAVAVAGASTAGVVAATQEEEKKEDEKKDEEKKEEEKKDAAAPKEERRRSSFFGLGSKKSTKPAEKKENDAEKKEEETESAPVTTTPAVAAAAADEDSKVTTNGEDSKVITNGEVKDEQKTAEKEKKSKFGDLFRRPSKLAKEVKAKRAAEKEAPVAEESPAPETTAATTVVEPLAPTATDKITENGPAAEASIGDVVPEAVTVGEGPKPVAANA